MIKDVKLIIGILSTLIVIFSSISVDIAEENEPNQYRPNRQHYRRYYLLDKDSNKFLKRLRRATNLLMAKSDDEKSTTKQVMKAVKTVAKEIKEIKGHKHKDKSSHKTFKDHRKNRAKVVSVNFNMASMSFVLSFTLPKFLNYYI